MVVAIVGLMTAMAFRPTYRAVQATKLRSARVALANYVATARAASMARNCRTVFHVLQGSVGRVWVTACRVGNVGAATGAVDTVGRVDSVGARYGVTLSATADSVVFDASGLTPAFTASTFRVLKTSMSLSDSLVVNAVGKVVR